MTMPEPWYDPLRWGWLPGTALGVVGGLWGSLAGVLGRTRPTLLIASLWAWLVGSAILLVVAIVALIQGQPYGVWYGLLLPGALGTALGVMFLIVLVPVLRAAHRQAEELKMQARDLG
jgi:hypothetical protein